jgi:amino acid adenylation domain-containing protein
LAESSPIGDAHEAQLSYAQQRLWLLDRFDDGQPAYNVGILIEWRGPICVDTVRKSFEAIIRRHEVLRTSYPDAQGKPRLRVAETLNLPFRFEDISHLDNQQRGERLHRTFLRAGRYPFRLKEEIPIRVDVVKTAEQGATLCLVMHHIACDAWSMGVLVGELAAFYNAFSRDRDPSLPDLPIQYRDFAHWQRAQLTGDYFAGQLAYWKEQLKDLPPPLSLPTDRPRPPLQTYRGAREAFALGPDLSQGLAALARSRQTTMYALLMSLFALLLYRWTGARDVLIGTPVANRDRKELESLIGFFVNTVAVRLRMDADMDFDSLLRQAHATIQESFAHQDIPFESVVEHAQTDRNLSHSPLFQVLFSYQNAPRQRLGIEGVEIEIAEIDNLTSKFDLSVTLGELDGEIKGWVEYNTDLFNPDTIGRFVSHYRTLAAEMVKDSTQTLQSCAIMPPEERSRILGEMAGASFPLPEGQLVHRLFEASAQRHGEAIAVQFGSECLSYAQLERRANRLAHFLVDRGVQPNSFVGVFLDRSEFVAIALIGILKAGGAYVPLDPSYPRQRLDYILADTQAKLVLSQDALLDGVPGQVDVVSLDGDPALSSYPDTPPRVSQTEDHLAYCIHTSGSTGRPKGVQISHRNAVSFLLASQRYFPIGSRDSLLAVTTLSFDISVLEIFLPLLGGGRVRMVARETVADGAKLKAILESEPITYMQATPSTWKILLTSHWQSRPGLTMLCGGEAMPLPLARELTTGGGTLFNCYGPTETTVWSAYERIEPGCERIAIGRPCVNERIYILDARGQPVPIGIEGHLYIGGPGVSPGYLNRDDLTQERFVADPFATEPGATLYDTGDLARFLADGRIEYIGRNDFQVKIRGFRIELAEIEAVIDALPEVAETAVVVHEGAEQGKRIVAYLVAAGQQRLSINQIKESIRTQLPEYMIPSVFVFMERLPLTPNGKIDRKRLPEPEAGRPELEARFIAARNASERMLVTLWQELLGIETIGIHDNFFDLGGHSLLVVEMHARLTERTGRQFPVIDLFRYTTVADLAEFLDSGEEKPVMDTQAMKERQSQGQSRLRQRFQRGRAVASD